MRTEYRAVFTNDAVTCATQIIRGDGASDSIAPMIVEGVIIETDGFEVLSIGRPENYSDQKLKIFDYNDKSGSLILKNYNLRAELPVTVIEKHTGKESIATFRPHTCTVASALPSGGVVE